MILFRTMKNLGDKLLKARTDMGYTVRDAADATRLRADIIDNMESGEFDYNLPEIYKRGFLRIYAAFLKLDVDSIMEQYTIASRSFFSDGKRKTILSRMTDVATSAQQTLSNSQSTSFNATPASVESRFDNEQFDSENSDENADDSSSKFLKLAAVFGGVILAVVVIIFVVSSIVGKKAPEENVDIAMNADISTQPVNTSTQSPTPINEVETELVLVLTALSDTYVLVYPDYKTPDGKPAEVFFTGPMQAGEHKEFRSKVPIMLKLTDAERVKIERNGKPVDLKGAKGLGLFRIVLK